jgi:glycosyltransferase involved in cell wall biosynthesis
MRVPDQELRMSEASSLPLVSCLCVTRGKSMKLARAVECFHAQSYPNRELVLVVEEDDAETLAAVEQHLNGARGGNVRVHVVSVSPKLSLGELRNRAVAVCNGEYFCQWDDDDWFHVDRITRQVSGVTRAFQSATLLTSWLVFDVDTGDAYQSLVRLWEGSILCKKSVLSETLRYPAMPRMEDAFFVNDLIAAVGVLPQIAPTLYIYEIHRKNTWTAKHFAKLLEASQPLSLAASALVRDIMTGQLSVAEGSRRLDSRALLEELRYVPRSMHLSKEVLDQYLMEMTT